MNNKAFSVIEYAVLFVIVIGAFLIMRNYMQRGVFGLWAQSGQSFGFGRQYDPQKTVECAFDDQTNQWYDRRCYESLYAKNCPQGTTTCVQEQMNNVTCADSYCVQLNNH